MDDADRRLIGALRRDGRASVSALAAQLEMPRSTVQDRFDRLVQDGTIRRFVPVLDHARLGQGQTVYLFATFTPGQGVSQRRVAQELAQIPEIVEVSLIAGEWDILLKVRAADMKAVGDLIIDRIRNLPGIERTLSCSSYHTEKEEYA